ncbi:MAG TPA: TIGR03086 family metal-binding protein [Streptosporangiaceae bacterium]|nr:TIGR03086 family metal-binding protein [Streptosporangiaceae bacterium]
MTVNLDPAARQLADLVAQVSDDDLAKPTPCPAYTVGDLIDHIGGLTLAFTAAASKETGGWNEHEPSGDASRLDAGWRARIPRDLAALAAAWQRPGAWTGMTRIAGSDTPAEMTGLACADELVVHGWDVARATGRPYAVDPDALEAAHTFLGYFASPDAPAGPDVAFGPSRQVPDDAPPLDRVIALAGRDPRWLSG